MKKIILSFTTLLFLSLSQAQVLQFAPDSKLFQSLITRKINVVETGNEDFDNALHSAFDTYWKSTDYEFISYADFEKVVSDQTKSFFIPMNISTTISSSSHTSQKTKSWYILINGGKNSIDSYTDDDVIAFSPIGLYTGESDLFSATYRLDYIVKSTNDAIRSGKEKQIKGQFPESLEIINAEFLKIAKEKTLIINEDAHSIALGEDRGQTTPTKAFTNYPYKYKFVNDSEFKEILAGSNEEYICLLPIIDVIKHVIVYEPSSKKTVYYGWKRNGLIITAGDIKSLTKAEVF